jgi:putative tricarboxylic transport membrane protein
VQRIDRWLGLALALLGMAVFWSSRDFPAVPGQKVGAGFLPGLVGIGLLLCAVGLLLRSRRAPATAPEVQEAEQEGERYGAAAVIVAVALAYIFLADWLGFLILAPVGLLAVFLALGVRLQPALLWALGGTVVVHVGFYKLLRVPLPWGLLPPLY